MVYPSTFGRIGALKRDSPLKDAIVKAWDVVSRRGGELPTPETIASILRQAKDAAQSELKELAQCTATEWRNGCISFHITLLQSPVSPGEMSAREFELHDALFDTLVPIEGVMMTGRQSLKVQLSEGVFHQTYMCTDAGVHSPLDAMKRAVFGFVEQTLEQTLVEETRHEINQVVCSDLWEQYSSWNFQSNIDVDVLCSTLERLFHSPIYLTQREALKKCITDAVAI